MYIVIVCRLHPLDDSGVTSISSVLPVLSKMLDGTKVKNGTLLLSCLVLEKETTGALLLARREEVLEHLLNLHRSNQVQRKYWYNTSLYTRIETKGP